MEKTLGGDRLGSGKKMKVHLHGYERSTHNKSYLWRSTMSAGTLVPFIKEVALPGDTFDISLGCEINTHPTIGPLFGSYKVQLDIFLAPIRLYQGQLHNNKLGIGMNMAAVKLPVLELLAKHIPATTEPNELDTAQINPSSILAYLGTRGVGNSNDVSDNVARTFNGVPLLAYWDIYKNYYANKQEEIGAVIHSAVVVNETVDQIGIITNAAPEEGLSQDPATSPILVNETSIIRITYTGTPPNPADILFYVAGFTSWVSGDQIALDGIWNDDGTVLTATFYHAAYGTTTINSWRYRQATDVTQLEPKVVTFPLENIDKMRERILAAATSSAAFDIKAQALTPYSYITGSSGEFHNMLNTQEGLAIKTYQSDLYNNWLSTEWIDGAGGITEVTAIDTSGGSFTIDTLNLSKKVYDMLNRIAVSGGTYDDWLDAVYTHPRHTRAESPMYMGGLIKELVFQEVVSNTETEGQPLGTLAGKGVMGKKHKGGYIHINVDEPSYIIGLISLTPRIDYSQGNDWDIHLKTMDDFHKPALDEIGFQELITEQMAWWDTNAGAGWIQKSAGKQPAWINYMTNVNKLYGNFAIPKNEMFMTLNRRYEPELYDTDKWRIKDLTTYIDPIKFNYIFAKTSLDAMNFWVNIGVDLTARRKMSAKLMPNL